MIRQVAESHNSLPNWKGQNKAIFRRKKSLRCFQFEHTCKETPCPIVPHPPTNGCSNDYLEKPKISVLDMCLLRCNDSEYLKLAYWLALTLANSGKLQSYIRVCICSRAITEFTEAASFNDMMYFINEEYPTSCSSQNVVPTKSQLALRFRENSF